MTVSLVWATPNADQIIGDRYGYKRPPGGFFLWLDVSAHGGDEAVTQKLWRLGGLRVIPGHYLARDGSDGRNPGTGVTASTGWIRSRLPSSTA